MRLVFMDSSYTQMIVIYRWMQFLVASPNSEYLKNLALVYLSLHSRKVLMLILRLTKVKPRQKEIQDVAHKLKESNKSLVSVFTLDEP